MASATPEKKPVHNPKLSLSSKILIGLVTGVACGLFFGESVGWLSVWGEAFIDLLQMTVLPFIVVALILNIGRLASGDARRLAGKAGLVLLLMWAVAAVAIIVVPQAFPAFSQGSFFSADLVQPPAAFNPLDEYIPENPFHSLANNVVPAVVLFCIFLGVALIGVDPKDSLLGLLEVASKALTRVNSFVVQLTPYGIFAIAASASGTLTIEEVTRLRAYLLAYTLTGAALGFVVLPLLVSALTPFGYRQVVGVSRDAVMTAFATGKLFVVLPLLIDASNRLFAELEARGEPVEDRANVLVPLAYPFPSVGKLLALLFIPFAAWFVGSPLGAGEYPALIGAGLLTLFGSPLASIPYLLDLFRLPSDMFNLFMLSGVWCTRIGDVVGAVQLLAFSLLATCAVTGRLRVDRRRMVAFVVTSAVVAVVGGVGMRVHIGRTLGLAGGDAGALDRMSFRRVTVPYTVLDESAPNPVPLGEGRTRLGRIHETGVLRVGFNPDEMPFAFFNSAGELVGFDIEMAHRMALELGVEIEFAPFAPSTIAAQLEEDHFDIAMSGVIGTYSNLEEMLLAFTGIEVTGALVVPDHYRDEFASIDAVREIEGVRLGVVGNPVISARVGERMPGVELIELESNAQFFEGRAEGVMGMITIAEAGSGWTLRHPRFQVVVPERVNVKAQIVYPIAQRDLLFRGYVERWAVLAREGGTVNELYEHWILGRGATVGEPRWSIARDVLGWGE